MSGPDIATLVRTWKTTTPNESSVYEFFATRLDRSSELVPIGLVMAWQLAIYDMARGVDGFTGEPITGQCSGLPAAFYRILDADIGKRFATLGEFGVAAESHIADIAKSQPR